MLKQITTELKNENVFQSIKTLLSLVSPKEQVQFALICIKDLDNYYDNEKYPECYQTRQKIITLLTDWLLGNPLSPSQLFQAARAAEYAAGAVYAAGAAGAVYAARAAANAARAPVYAAKRAAAETARAAANAARAAKSAANNDNKLKQLRFELIKILVPNQKELAVLEVLYGDNK